MERISPSWMVKNIVRKELERCALVYATGKLLDIGCGDKNKESIFGSYVETYLGLDHAESIHGLEAVDIVASAYETTEQEASYDTVISTAVLEHLEEPQKALNEAYRILKPKGYAIYTVPLFWHLHEEPRDFYRYTEYGLKYLFENAGFEIIELKPLSGFLVTFFTELGYYLQCFKKGPLGFLVDALVVVSNCLIPRLDRDILRNEKFTWMYLVVVRKPE